MKNLLVLLFLTLGSVLCAQIKICAHCGQSSRNLPYTAENKSFCSQKCLAAKCSCSICRELPKGRYMIRMASDGTMHRFCGKCGSLPICFSCMLPAANRRVLDDGRNQCRRCSSTVLSFQQYQQLLEEVRRDLKRLYGFDTDHKIILRQVSQKALARISQDPQALGCMKADVNKTVYQKGKRKRTEVKWKCTLYILSDLPAVTAAKIMAHELTHDYLYHHAGRGRDPQITEGICEAVSGAYLESKKYTTYLNGMQKNPDPVYGTGFRLIFPQLKSYGLKSVVERYRSNFTPF